MNFFKHIYYYILIYFKLYIKFIIFIIFYSLYYFCTYVYCYINKINILGLNMMLVISKNTKKWYSFRTIDVKVFNFLKLLKMKFNYLNTL